MILKVVDDIEHPAAARRFRDQEPETSRWLALLLAFRLRRATSGPNHGELRGAIRSATSDDIQTILAVPEGYCLREGARQPSARRHRQPGWRDARRIAANIAELPKLLGTRSK